MVSITKRRRFIRPNHNILGLLLLTASAYCAIEVGMSNKRIYVERRSEGDYAVRRAASERASAIEPTQAKAIEKARELNPGIAPHVERVRDTSVGGRDKWRKP